MYDNVHLWLPKPMPNASAMADRYNGTPIADKTTGEIKGYQWHARNLRVSCFSKGISIKGSLPKYLCGDNVQTIDTTDTAQAIAEISNLFGVDMAEAYVSYIEVGKTFVMDNPPVDYFAKLGDGGRYLPRMQAGTTLYYGKQIKKAPKCLIFYDKADEIASRGDDLPQLLDDTNLLRYELRLINQRNYKILRKFGIKYASALTDKATLAALRQDYITSFDNIKKVTCMADGIKPNKDWMLANLIAMHPADAETLLASVRAAATPLQIYRLKQAINKTMLEFSAKKDVLLQELEDCIKSV